jgi:PAS domain S-box-containing protein
MLLERKLLDLAFGKVKFSVISALLLASLIVIALWSVIEHERLLAWLGGIVVVKVLHFLYLHRYKRHGHRADVHPGKWETGLVAGAAVAGLGWGSAVFCFPSSPFNPMTLFGVFILPSTPFDPVTVLLIFILAGVTAYASVALAFVPLAAFAFFACAWLPLAIWLFSFGEQMYVVMGLIALSYLGVMVMLSRRMHATVCSLISVSEENRGLRTAQQESDRRMQRFFESAPGFFYTACMTPDGKSSMPFVSEGIVELFDVAPGDVADSMSPLFALMRGEDIEQVIKERDASRRNLSPFRIEFRINHRIKGERWIELNSLPQREPDGSTNWHGFMQNITERKRMEESVAASEREFRTLAENFPDVVIRYDLDGRRTYVNRALAELAGAEPDEMLGKFRENTPLVDPEAYTAELHRVIATRDAADLEVAARGTDGGISWYQARFVPEFDAGNNVSGVLMVAGDITERRRMEQELQRREADFRTLAENLPVAVIRYDAEQRRRYINPAAERMLHGNMTELLGKVPGDGGVPATPAMIEHYRGKMEEVLATSEARELDFVLDALPTDRQEHFEVRFVPERDADGQAAGVLSIWFDITGRKRMEQTLAASERMLQEAQRIAHVGSWDVDMVNDKLVWSDEIFRIWEIDKTQFKADFAAFLETVHPEDQEHVVQAYNDAVVNRSLYEVEHRLLFPDGRVKHILERGEPQYDVGGKPVRFIGTSLDITERKFAEQYEQFRSHTLELLAGSHSLPDILEEVVLGVEQLNSRMLCSILLLDSEGKHLVDGVAPSLPDFYNEAIDGLEIGMGVGSCGTCAASGERVIVEDIQTHPYWEPFKELTTRAGLGACWSQPVCSSSGKVLGTFAIYHGEASSPTAQDISLIEKIAHIASIAIERKRMEAELVAREQEFSTLVDQAPEPIFRYAPDGRRIYVNAAVERITGIPASVLLGSKSADGKVVSTQSGAAVTALIQRICATGEPGDIEVENVGADGQRRYFHNRLAPEFGPDGKVKSVFSISHDITERKEMELALQASEREFRSLAGNIPDNIARLDTEGRYLYINPTHERTLGMKAEELIGTLIPDSHEQVKAGIRQVAVTGLAIHSVRQPVMVDGVEELHDVSLMPEFDEAGKVVSVLGIGRDMTERYRMLETIAAREQEFRSLAESSPDFIVRYDREGRTRYLNTSLERLLGLGSVDEVIGKRPSETWPDGRFDPVEQAAARAVETGGTEIIELFASRESGEPGYSQIYVVPERDSSGEITGTIAFGRDITAIRETERKLSHFIDNIPGIVYTFRLSPDGQASFPYVSFAIREIYGLEPEEATGDFLTIHNFSHPDDRPRIEAAIAESARTMQPYRVESRVCRPGSPERWLDVRSIPLREPDGSTLWYGLMLDITERKRMEEALAERQAFLDSLFEAIPVPVFYKDREGRYQGFNRAYESVFGENREKLIGKSVFDTHPRELAETYHAKDAEVFERRVALQQYEYKITHADGTLRDVLFSKAAFTDVHGEVNGLIGAVIDITERKRMEETLQRSEQLMRTVIDATPDWIFIKDQEHRYRLVNQGYADALHLVPEDFIGKNDLDLGFPEELVKGNPEKGIRGFWADDRLVLDSNETHVYSDDPATIDGVVHTFHTIKVPLLDAGEKPWGVLAFARDITERKQAELALRASEELAQSRSSLLNAIVESSPDVIVFALDTDYRYLSFNRKHKEIMQAIWGREIAAGMSMLEVIGSHPDREQARRGFDRALSGESFVLEEAYGDEALSRQYWQNYWSPIRAETGEVVGLTCFVMNVTERRRIEDALRANEEKLSNLFELSPLGIALTDMQGKYVEFNEAFRRICGYPTDELMTLDYWTLTPRKYEADEGLQLESLAQTGRYGPYEKEYQQKDGTLVPIQLSGVLMNGKDGQQYIWSIVEDITERKQTEALLKEKFARIVELNDYLEETSRTMEEHAVELEASQEQLKHALEFSNGVINALPDLLFEMDRNGRYLNVWAQNPELLAAQKRTLLGHTLDDVLAPESAAISLEAIREAEANGVSTGKVIWIDLPQGTRWFELSVSRKADAYLSDARFLVLSRDVTERRRTEDVLRFVAEGEWIRGGDSFLDALVRYLGKSLGVDYVVIDKVADEPGYVETVARYVKGEIAPNVRYGLQSTPCGEVMTGTHCCHGENIQGRFPEAGLLKDMGVESYAGIPLRDIDGAVIGLVAVLHEQPLGDTHFVKSILQMVAPSAAAELERSRMEQVLRENYDALNEAQRISHVGNWELDLASGALVWSDEIYRIFEIDQTQFGASYEAFIDAIHPDDREAVNCAYSESLASCEPYEVEHRLLFADGRIKYVHERCETRYDDDGKPLRSLGTVQDITARKQAEESLRESYDKISELNRHLEKNATHLEENARYLEEQATELEASQEQLKQTEAWYRSILHSAPEGMLVVDDHGLIMQVNARLEAMFGYASGELPGHRVEELLPRVARETHAGQRGEYFASGVASRPAMVGKTLFGCRKDGSTFPVDVSLARLPEVDGRRSAVCASVRDITERQAMEAARETALAEAQRLAQLRSAFMAQMSHELRTPLNGILGYAQNLLQGDALGEKQVAGLNIIQHSGEHLLSLINGLLDHAAIEANKFELIEGDIELDSFLSAIIGIIRVRAEQKNLAFTCEAGGGLPAVVRGDAQRLRQVLINLLANAVKFTDSGDVILRVRLVAPTRIRFEVKDSGVGIAADQLENIFLPFEQTGELQRRAGGSGLGLSISRTLVRLMGGDIRVESRPGAGSVFSFEIEIGVVQSGRAGLDATALSERAETRATQATPMLPAPPRQELDTLHALALRGSMRDVTRHADKLAEADERYQPFAAQLRRLAQGFQTKALLGLIEQYRNREQEE